MASRDNDSDNNALAKARLHPTNVKDKENVVTAKASVPSSEAEAMNGEGSASVAVVKAKAKEGSPSQKQQRSGSESKCTSKISKLRRLSKLSSRSRCIIPEARVIQASYECAYIYDSEHDDSKGEANGGKIPIKASVAVVPEWLLQKIQQQQQKEEKVEGKANSNGNDRSRHMHVVGCHCFDCW